CQVYGSSAKMLF
nr:immunoglobulin light chain junction region [Macaca mulatta]